MISSIVVPVAGNGATVSDRNRYAFDRALGPLRQYLARDGVYNANVNADDSIWIEERGRGKYLAPETMTEIEREALIGIIANTADAGPISKLSSSMAFDMPFYNARGQAFCAPIGPKWPLMLRNHATEILTDDKVIYRPRRRPAYVPLRASTFYEAIAEAIRRRWNIVVSGPQNSGKTTHMSWLLSKIEVIREYARLIVMQDRDELRVTQRDHVKLFADVPQKRYDHDGSAVLYTYGFCDLIPDVLRCSADLYVYGELRSPEAALGLVMAANNGAEGILVGLHANTALDALYRIEDLIALAPDVKFNRPPRQIVARFAQLVIQLGYDEVTRERWVDDVQAVPGAEDDAYVLEDVVVA
jgi:Flp pilus assembly CpaF family ATPase